MSDRDALYLTALLQDLGVFVGRAGIPEWEARASGFAASGLPPERALTAALLSEYAAGRPFLPGAEEFASLCAPGAEKLGAPGAASVSARLLRIAAACAEPDVIPESGPSDRDFSRIRLESPFSRIALTRAGTSLRPPQPFHIALEPLSIRREALFPAAEGPPSSENPYRRVVSAFLEELGSIRDEAGLFALLEKYLYSVPLGAGRADVSLFDRSRATAAIALCLHDELTDGAWRAAEAHLGEVDPAELPAPCLLVSGGLSGIQDFIFDVPSRRASKSLKGRSYFVQLAADGCVRDLLDALDLGDASLLYSGGGNFFMLVPACRAPALEEARRRIAAALLPESLSLALGWVPVGVGDFLQGRFGACWKAAREQVEQRKGRRFQELGIGIFEPFAQGPRDEEGREDSFADLTERLTRSTAYTLVRGTETTETAEGRLLARLGLRVHFTPAGADPRATAFNETDFAGRFRNFRFAVKDLPRFTDAPPDEAAPGSIVDFDHLAGFAGERTGTHKLGVLKMDVDDLGQIFLRGLPERQRGVARIAALSRTMRWFFEGYVNTLLREGSFTWRSAEPAPRTMHFAQQLYPVFSGGDDFLLVGAWDAVFEFALRVRGEFAAFVGGHPGITLSASLLVLEPQTSISRFAAEAGARLDNAKEARVEKDCVSVFGQVLTWEELDEAARLKGRLEVLVKQRGESRALVQRVQQSATGYRRLRDAAVRGRFHPERIWRLAYFLARNARTGNVEEVKSLAEIHQRLLLDAYINPATARNPTLFTVAGRWAELATRDVEPAGDDRRDLSSR